MRFRVVALAFAALLGGTALVYRDSAIPPLAQTLTVPELTAPVTVWRDEHWVPHIFAETLSDAALALGFVHAQDRIWQMDTIRRFTSGRLAEVLGSRALAGDRWMRTLGLEHLTEQECHRLAPDTARQVAAYVAGVNLWLQARGEALPPEFDLLRFQPHPWSCKDTLLTSKALALRLARNRSDELLRWQLSSRLTPEQLAELWPEADAVPQPMTLPPPEMSGVLPRAPADSAGRQAFSASNAWVVDGDLSATGSPLLANDPHLRLTMPNTWHLVRIVTPEGELTGASVPGLPFLVAGHNGQIAWGVTSSEADIEDLIVERVTMDGANTLGPDGPRPITRRDEVIEVRGEAPVRLEVRSTIHGPIVSEVLGEQLPGRPPEMAPPIDGKASGDAPIALALAATYLADDDRTADAALRLNLARSWSDFTSALANFQVPPLNFLYADRSGSIGMALAGRIPDRAGHSGFGPMEGWTGAADWIGYVPFDRLPRYQDPGAGFLLNANERTVTSDFSWYVGSNWEPPFRAERLSTLIGKDSPMTMDAASRIQLDTVSPAARRLLPLMLEGLPETDRDGPLTARLQGWQGEMDGHRVEPTLFAVWLRELDRALFADELGDAYPGFQAVRPTLTETVLTHRTSWCDDISTPTIEDCGQQLARSLQAAEAFLNHRFGPSQEHWRWDMVHRAPLRHPLFDQVPVLGWLIGDDIATGGGWDTVSRGAYQVWDEDRPFAHVHGAGLRAVYDLADLSRSRFVIAGGQSGNVMSRHFDDFTRLWQEGGWVLLAGDQQDLSRRGRAKLTLAPR